MGERGGRVYRLGAGGDDLGELGERVYRLLHKGLSVRQGREVVYVGDIDGLVGWARDGRQRKGSGVTPSCLKAAVDVTTFVIRRMDPSA